MSRKRAANLQDKANRKGYTARKELEMAMIYRPSRKPPQGNGTESRQQGATVSSVRKLPYILWRDSPRTSFKRIIEEAFKALNEHFMQDGSGSEDALEDMAEDEK